MTQQQLGAAAGYDRTYINKIERGGIVYPTEETIERLAAALGVTADALLETVETPEMLREERGIYFIDPDDDELMQIYSRLPEPDRKRLRAIARALWILDAEE